MKKALGPLTLAVLLFCASPAPGQAKRGDPEIGYLYPAGARQGTSVRVLVGGMNLRAPRGVHVTGDGVRATIVRYMGRFVRLNRKERRALRGRLRALKQDADGGRAPQDPGGKAEENPELVKLDRHPLLHDLEALTPEEIAFVERKFLRFDFREQPNAQIGETIMIEVRVDAGAPPGDRELRLITRRGLTNPLCFQVGQLPEVREGAPADPREPDTEAVDLPAVLNGQITPGDADRFFLRARQGQRLVIRTSARRLVPFLADAVPGWFQAVLSLRNQSGEEIAYADDFRFDPDPVLFFEVPETGVYELEIRDALYRGRDDFVYRVAVSEQPFIHTLFPLGGKRGEKTVASIGGWNLDAETLPLDTGPGPERIRRVSLEQDGAVSNEAACAVDDLPEILETEPNDLPAEGQTVGTPSIVNGRIEKPGDRDVFLVEGRAGERLVAEVTARRLRSPLDSLLRLRGPSGKVLAWNDDFVEKQGHLHRGMGVLTHHADAYLSVALPEDGVYGVEISDARGHGSGAHAYRLRIGPPRPDFALFATPSGLTLGPGRASVIHVHALRKDGFDGEIEVSLQDAPSGFALHGGGVPAGCDHIRMTLRAPLERSKKPVRWRLEGRARIAGKEVRREAAPADNEMQAFLWRHLVPAREGVAVVLGQGVRAPVVREGEGPVRIPCGGSARVVMRTPPLPNPDKIELALNEAPEGIRLADVKVLPRRIEFTLQAAEATALGFADNLIVDASTAWTPKPKNGKKAKPRRVWLGVLPAIPIRVVKP